MDELLHFLEDRGEDQMTEVAASLITKVHTCLTSGAKSKLPSAVQGTLWNNFHKLRNSDEVKRIWSSFVSSSQACACECELTLQLLLDTMLKKMLENKASVVQRAVSSESAAELTLREKSVVRYMAGYVATDKSLHLILKYHSSVGYLCLCLEECVQRTSPSQQIP